MKTDLEADMASECNKLGPVDKVSASTYILAPANHRSCHSVIACACAALFSLEVVYLSCTGEGNSTLCCCCCCWL